MTSRKVTKEEMAQIGTKPHGRGHPVRKLLQTLEPGETLYIHRRDWKWKYNTPNVICKDLEKRLGWQFNFSKAADNSGWFAERVE
jgi:hypothetical protein